MYLLDGIIHQSNNRGLGPVVQRVTNAIHWVDLYQWTTLCVLSTLIYQMVIYSVDGIIHPLNNWVLQLIWPTVYRWIKPAANLLSNVCFHKSHKIKMEFGQKGPAEAGQQVVLVPIVQRKFNNLSPITVYVCCVSIITCAVQHLSRETRHILVTLRFHYRAS